MKNLAHAVCRRSELKVNSQVYPGFISYTGNDTSFGTDGLLLHSATIEIGDHHSNPTTLDDRAESNPWVFGQKLEIWVERSDETMVLHPRGTLYLLSAHYSQSRLIVNCGCVLSLLKVLGTDDFNLDEDWLENFSDTKLYNNSAIANLLASVIDKELPSVPGKSWGPVSISGSIVDYLGNLAFVNSSPGVIWSDHDDIKFASVNLKQPATWLTVTVGKNEISYEAIDSGLNPISELIVTGQIKEPKLPEVGETTEEDGSTEVIEQDSEYGPESLLNSNASDDEILFATVDNIERISPSLKYAETKRTERTGLVFPSAKVNRYTMVVSYRERTYQHFDPVSGRLMYEERILEEPFGKVYSSWLGKRTNWIVTNPGNLGINGSEVSLGTTYADELLTSTALVRSQVTKTTYVYNDRGVVVSKITTTREPASKVAAGSPTLSADDYITSYNSETWKERGKNQNKKVVDKRAFEAAKSSEVESLQKSRYDALVASGSDSTINVPTFTRNSDGTISLGNTDVPQDLVGLTTRLSLITNTKNTKRRLSRAGLETPPATEYLPNIKPTSESEQSDKLEDVDIKVTRKWDATLLAKAPREVASIGLIDSKSTLEQIADYLFKLRQGQVKSYEIVLPLTDDWLDSFTPGNRIDVVVNGQVVSYVANGLTYKSEPNQNLVLIDGLWVGGMPGSPVSLIDGVLSTPGFTPGSPVYVPSGWGIPSGNYSTQASGSGYQLLDSSGNVVQPVSIPLGSQIVNLSASNIKPAFSSLDLIVGGVRVGGSVTVVDLGVIRSTHTGGANVGGAVTSELNPYFDLMATCRNDVEGLPGGRVLTASNSSLGGIVDVVLDEYFTVLYGDIKVYHISDLYAWPDPSAYYLVGTIPATGDTGVNVGAIDGEWVSFFAYNSDKEADSALRATYDRSSNTVTIWGFFTPLTGGG